MRSERQIQASRANGAKSRGPVTPEGKTNSSRNNLRHGLRAEVLFPDHQADRNWIELLASHLRELQPRSAYEQSLVEIIALSCWRRKYLWNLESAIFNREINRAKSLPDLEEGDTPLAFAFRALTSNSCAIELLNRLEARCSRDYFNAFNSLREHRAGRSDPAENPVPEKAFIDGRTQQAAENTTPHPEKVGFEEPNPAQPAILRNINK